MRNREQDERWIRDAITNRSEAVYVTPNHYDGGYEVRVGSLDFFVDYETIDAGETSRVAASLK